MSFMDKIIGKLNAKKRKNVVVKSEEVEEVSEKVVEEVSEEVIVVETGYLLSEGIKHLLKEDLKICMPYFCIKELEKISRSNLDADDILNDFWSSKKCSLVNLRYVELLYKEPKYPVKKRSYGIVAVCTDLITTGHKVRLCTSSREVAKLAVLQDIGINVVRVDA